MVKEKRILSYFIGWLLIGFIIMFIGVNKIFASTYYMNYNYQQQYYDNSGSSVSAVNTSWNDSFNSYISENITTVAGSYGAGLSITSPIPLLEGHTYSMSVYFEDINNIALSSKNVISVASSLNSAANDYANNIPGTEMIFSKVSNNKIIQFVFKVDNNHTHLFFPWTTTSTSTQSYILTQVVMEDLGSSGITENEINQSLNNQTNEINNSIQNSTNTITDKIDDMEQSIVDSNKETQDVIKDQFNSCRPGINLFDINTWYNSLTSNNGSINLYTDTIEFIAISNSMTNIISNYNFKLKPGTNYTLSFNAIIENNVQGNTWLNLGLEAIDNVSYGTLYINSNGYYTKTFTTNSNGDFYLKGYVNADFTNNNKVKLKLSNIMLNEGSSAKDYEPYGEICSNKIDDTNNKLDGIQGALTDSSTPNISGLENSAGWLPAGPLDSILNLPLTMLKSLTNSLTKTCYPLNLRLPYVNKDIQIPCLSAIFAKITGVNGLWTWVGTIASVLILYNYLLNLYAWVDRVLTLRAEFDEAMGADLANWGRL